MRKLDSLAAGWPVISALLDEALALPATERNAWLQALPAERDAIRSTLQALLATQAEVETGDFLGTLPRLAPAFVAGDLPLGTEARAGETVGPYRLLSELGHGGMGDVWLAERADGELKRRVALKLPRVVWGDGLAERMRRERDILASLEHPHIARLYDAGVDSHGRPYLALEYVEGEPIDVYCNERTLPLAGRVGLLLQVAGAVAHAHSRLVVHRDLKPSNILVTAGGEVRLLDFGIAKLMQSERTADTALTQLSGRAMTLDYASPEQIRGEPLGTTSDVYSLAVVAYELLAGAKPYRLKRGSAAELEEAISQTDPPRASDVAGEPAVRPQLRGDLDAILNKALKKDPAQRYPSVASFADDLQRHRDGHAVHALPDSRLYRTRKFVRRNRLAVAMTSALGVAIVGGSGVAVWQALVAREQAANAAASVERLDGIVALYVETMSRLSVMGAQDPAALARPRAVTGVLQDKLREMAPRFSLLPNGRQGQLRAVMVQLNFNNEFEASLAVGLEYLAHLKSHAASADIVIQAHNTLGKTLFQLRRLDESEAMRRAGVEWAPDVHDSRTELARLSLMSDLGGVLTARGKRREAEAVLMRAEALAQRSFPDAKYRFFNLLKLSEFHLGFDDARALQLAQQGQAGVLASGTADPEDRAWDLLAVGVALLATGRAAEAEVTLREALGFALRDYGRTSRNSVRASARVAGAIARQGKHAQARAMLAEELRVLNPAAARSPFTPLLLTRQIENEWLHGDVAAAAGLVSADLPALLQPQAVRDNEPLVRFESRALAAVGRGQEALARMQALQRSWPDPDTATAPWLRILDALAFAQLAAGEPVAAAATTRSLLVLLDQQQARSGWAYRSAAEMAALAAARSGDLPGAARALALADAMAPVPAAPSSAERAESALQRAEVLAALGRSADSLSAARAALADLADQHATSPRLARARHMAGASAS